VLYTKPENPLDALVAECERAAKARDAGSKNEPKFFTFDDLKGMFSLFDPTGRGVISRAQVQTGMLCSGQSLQACRHVITFLSFLQAWTILD